MSASPSPVPPTASQPSTPAPTTPSPSPATPAPPRAPATPSTDDDARGKITPVPPKFTPKPTPAPATPTKPPEPFFIRYYVPANMVKDKKFEVCYPKIRHVIAGLKQTPSNQWLKEELQKGYQFLGLYNSTSSYGKDIASLWNQKIADNDFVAHYTQLFDLFFAEKWLDKLAPPVSGKPSVGDSETVAAYTNFSTATSVLWNTSDSCAKICCQIWKHGVAEKIIKLLQSDDKFAPEKLDGDRPRQSLTKAFLSVIMNALRRSIDSAVTFQELKGVELVLKYRDTKDTVLNVISSCALAYGASEEQIKTIPNVEASINFLLYSVLLMATRRENRRYRGFSVEETLDAINSMAAQKKVQEMIATPRCLAMMKDILINYKEDEELKEVTKLFWTLSFDAEIKPKVKEHFPTLVEELKKHQEHESDRVKKAVAGCLWNFEGLRPKTGKSKKATSGAMDEEVCPIDPSALRKGGGGLDSYIMISYNWGHKEVILLLNQALKAHGFSTWIDVEQMSGSTLDAMAGAVEKASVVLICVSERYKESPNCRAEAEYAFRLNKPIVPLRMQPKFKPDGWLGIIMGTKFYFDCIHRQDISLAAEKVANEIRKNHATSPVTLSALPLERSASVPSVAQAAKVTSVKSWDADAVKNWLKEHNIEHLAKKFGKRFDGALVNQLGVLFSTKPEIFLALLERLRIDHPEDVLHLTAALQAQPLEMSPY